MKCRLMILYCNLSYVGTSQKSFCSGHASSAATIMGYVALLYIADLKYFKESQPSCAFVITQIILIPITVRI